jgi:gliding motility-associated-like protein
MIRRVLFFALQILLTTLGISQDSYSLDLKSSQSNLTDFTISEFTISEDKLTLLVNRAASSGGYWGNMNIVNVHPDGVVGESFEVELDSIKLAFRIYTTGLTHKNGFHIFAPVTILSPPSIFDKGSVVYAVNPELNFYRAWRTSHKNFLQGYTSLSSNLLLYCTQAMADTVLQVGATNPELIGISSVDLTTEEVLWSYRYLDNSNIGMAPRAFISLDNGQLIVLSLSSSRRFLVSLNENGEVVNTAELLFYNQNYSIRKMRLMTSGDLLLFGISTTLGEDRKGIIIKVSPSFQVEWGRAILVENFNGVDIDVASDQNGIIYFSFRADADFPIVLGRISADGQLLSNQGYGLQGWPEVDQQGSLYLFGNEFPSVPGNWSETHALIVKTDPDGNIDNCPQFDACVTLEDIDIQTVPITVTREPIPHIEPTPVSVYPAEFYTEPYCVTPEPPSALFHLPERVCEGTCLSPDSIFNATANHVEWRILGTELDTLIADTSFYWCFDTPGTYTVEQEVWVLGCSEFYARQLEVLPDDLTPPLMSDTILCQTPPYTLQPQSSRPLSSFLWSDGSMGPVLSVNQGGVIALEAGDGACTVRDTIQLQFVEELIPQGPYTQPEDVGLCEQLLPYLYRPYSAYTSEFALPGAEALPDGSFLLSEYGRYELSTELYGCPFSTAWELQELPCELPVYLPNAFSPNFDGINDFLEPQGIDFEPIRLQVFERWGGLLFQTSQAPFRWDGQRGNQAVNPGVYVVRFEYRNLRTGGVEEVVGEVVVVR